MIKKKDKYLLDDKEIVKKQSYKRGDIKKKFIIIYFDLLGYVVNNKY